MGRTLREEPYGDSNPMSEGDDISEDLSNQPINDPDD